MKPKPLSAFMLIMIISAISFAQKPTLTVKKRNLNHVSLAVTNSQTAMPFSKFARLFSGNYHPGMELSTGFNWKTKKKHDWIQDFNLGYSYHRWVQHSIVLYSEFGFRYKFPAGFLAETKIGCGYMRAIIATEVFSDGVEDGKQYSKISSGRSQAIASLSFLISKKIKSPAEFMFFLQYQQRIQSPFIQSYVSLLPYNIMKMGAAIPIKNNR